MRLWIALLCAVLLAGCANIPDRTLPKIVVDAPADAPRPIGLPAPGLDQFTLVQQFIYNAGTPDAARTYLTEEAKPGWKGSAEPTIIKDEFLTVPQSVQEGKTTVDEQVVVLTANAVGRLKADSSFVPGVHSVEFQVIVKRQAGQWRIAEPPNAVLITETEFDASYRQVNLEFFDPELRVTVPDPRYVEVEPREGLYGRVVSLLLAGPSESLAGAVRSQLDGLQLSTNVIRESDGAIYVNLTRVVDANEDEKQRIAAQIVTSLREVTTSPIRLLSEGKPLIAGKQDWTASDVGSYDALATLKPDLLGLVVAGGKLISLRDGKPVEGPAGAGGYDIVTAAQSLDGSQLAVVQRLPGGGVRLRVGRSGTDLPEVSLPPTSTLTRPTWLFSGNADTGPTEVWTVQDSNLVTRVVRTADGKWKDFSVEASELTRNGGTITQLRLSRDGTRVAAVVNGEVKVAAVVRTNDNVTISAGRTIQGGVVTGVVGLDWLDRLTVIVATAQSDRPVVSIPIDGLTSTPYNRTNLTLPITAITAAPSRSVVVTDGSGMWSTQEAGKIWLAHQYGQGPTSRPFYPG